MESAMMHSKHHLLCAALIVLAAPAFAQDAASRDGRGGARGGRGDQPPPPSPEQRLLTQMQTLLESDETEWAVLQPRIAQIQTLVKQRERFAKAKPPPPPRPARRADEPPPPEEEQRDPRLIVDIKPDPRASEVKGTATAAAAERYADLAKAASYEASTNELIAQLRAFRNARAAADSELAKAREELRQLVTGRQEVILVVMGILD
jgi:hypothetical protein